MRLQINGAVSRLLSCRRPSLRNEKTKHSNRAGVFDKTKMGHVSNLPQEDKFRRVRRLFLDNDVDNSGELGRQELDVAFIQMAQG